LRIRAALEIEQGLIVNTKLVLKIMRQLGLKGLPGPKKGYRNLKNALTCEDLVQRQFKASAPNEPWLTDITEHPTAWNPAVVATPDHWRRCCGFSKETEIGDREQAVHGCGEASVFSPTG
jgi:transposase InsO family protein